MVSRWWSTSIRYSCHLCSRWIRPAPTWWPRWCQHFVVSAIVWHNNKKRLHADCIAKLTKGAKAGRKQKVEPKLTTASSPSSELVDSANRDGKSVSLKSLVAQDQIWTPLFLDNLSCRRSRHDIWRKTEQLCCINFAVPSSVLIN